MKLTQKNLELAIAEAMIKFLKDGEEKHIARRRIGYALHLVLYKLHPGIVHHFGHERNEEGEQLQKKMEEMIESVAVFLGKDKIAEAKLARELAKKDNEIEELRAKIGRVEKEKKVLSS